MKHTSKCKQCPKSFTHTTLARAEQALRMHAGRTHKRNIIPPHTNGHFNGTLGAGKRKRSRLEETEVDTIVNFIRDFAGRYDSRTACFSAALKAAGVEGKITNNTTAVSRYFDKAGKRPAVKAVPVKRKYTKALKVQQVVVKFCPCCGCNLEAVATGIAMAATGM